MPEPENSACPCGPVPTSPMPKGVEHLRFADALAGSAECQPHRCRKALSTRWSAISTPAIVAHRARIDAGIGQLGEMANDGSVGLRHGGASVVAPVSTEVTPGSRLRDAQATRSAAEAPRRRGTGAGVGLRIDSRAARRDGGRTGVKRHPAAEKIGGSAPSVGVRPFGDSLRPGRTCPRLLDLPPAISRNMADAWHLREGAAAAVAVRFVDAPDRIRTCDLRFRKPLLYPPELRARRCRTRAIVRAGRRGRQPERLRRGGSRGRSGSRRGVDRRSWRS